jgi:molybdopterin/thiamine biosynthesis adenylyltransferase
MRTRWGEKDLDIALQRQMLFTSREAKQIKKQVLARMLSGLAPGAAAK